VLLKGGPVHFDLGYRYKQVLNDSAITTALSLDRGLRDHQFRFGVGVKF